jgi:hypothetical protein
MMSEKQKNTPNRLGTIPFAVLWTLAYGLGWTTVITGGYITSRFFPQIFDWFPDIVYLMLATTVPAFIYSIGQQFLIRWKFAVKFNWWFLWTTFAAAITTATFQTFEWINVPIRIDNPMVVLTLVFGYIFGTQALVQAWLLRKHVKRSWLWVAAAIASAATFGVPIATAQFFGPFATITTFGFAGLLQGAVMALTLVWLFGMTRVEPLKRGMDTTQLQQAEAKLGDNPIVNENVEDYLAAQSMGRRK